MLIKCLDKDEIRQAAFGLNGDSASDSDRFGGVLYHACWDFIGDDVCRVVKQFFVQNWVLPKMNSNVVSLIPKVPRPESIKDFRPIAIANFRFKIISQFLLRLSTIISRIISPNQNGFIKGRLIKDYICITSKAITFFV